MHGPRPHHTRGDTPPPSLAPDAVGTYSRPPSAAAGDARDAAPTAEFATPYPDPYDVPPAPRRRRPARPRVSPSEVIALGRDMAPMWKALALLITAAATGSGVVAVREIAAGEHGVAAVAEAQTPPGGALAPTLAAAVPPDGTIVGRVGLLEERVAGLEDQVRAQAPTLRRLEQDQCLNLDDAVLVFIEAPCDTLFAHVGGLARARELVRAARRRPR